MTYTDIYNVDGSGLMDKYNEKVNDGFKIKFFNTVIAILIVGFILLLIFIVLYSICAKKKCPNPIVCDACPDQVVCDACPEPVECPPPVECPSSVEQPVAIEQPAEGQQLAEPFTNDLPYQLNNTSLKLNDDDDYSQVLQQMSLDSEVIKQHNLYVNDRNKVTSTASFAPARSDNQDVVTSWGLSRPSYVAIDPSARNVPSQDPEQGSKPVRLQWK